MSGTGTFKMMAGMLVLVVLSVGCERRADMPRTHQQAGQPATQAAAASSPDSSGTSGTVSGASGSGELATRAIDDALITSKAKAVLLADPEVEGTDITVKTDRGEVLLTGIVHSHAELQRAVRLVGEIEGVTHIHNKITVKQ